MSGSEHPQQPAAGRGESTAGQGTPVPVDVSGDARTWRTMALLLAGPLLWTTHFMLVYLVVEAGCTGEGPGLRVFNPPVPTVVTLAATAVAAVACLATAALAYRRWRARREQRSGDGGPEPVDHGGSLAFAGFVLSLLGAVQVLFVGVPALVLPAC